MAASRGEALFERSEPALHRQAERILGMVEEVLAEARLELSQIEGIAYGEGPGSFTGLRVAAGEAHLLNLSIAAASQRRGHGRSLLRSVIELAREHKSKVLFLEVRPTNEIGKRLYAGTGFRQVGVRRGYYPARKGREDALVLALDL